VLHERREFICSDANALVRIGILGAGPSRSVLIETYGLTSPSSSWSRWPAGGAAPSLPWPFRAVVEDAFRVDCDGGAASAPSERQRRETRPGQVWSSSGRSRVRVLLSAYGAHRCGDGDAPCPFEEGNQNYA
jgi:hypothetical protein